MQQNRTGPEMREAARVDSIRENVPDNDDLSKRSREKSYGIRADGGALSRV